MLIGYSMPAVTAATRTGGTGHAWLTDDAGMAMFDLKPARRTRLRWRDDAAPAIAHAVDVGGVLASAVKPRIVCILGLKGVPVGTTLWALGRKVGGANTTYDLGGGNVGVARRFPNGSIGCWFLVSAAADPIDRIAIRIFNEAGGVTWATPATTIDIGEIAVMPAVDVQHESAWSDETVDPTLSWRTLGVQPASVPRTAYRLVNAPLTATSAAAVRGAGLPGGMDWELLRVALQGDARCMAIVRWQGAAGVADPEIFNRSALYGIGRMNAIAHVGGDYYSTSVDLQEVPALP